MKNAWPKASRNHKRKSSPFVDLKLIFKPRFTFIAVLAMPPGDLDKSQIQFPLNARQVAQNLLIASLNYTFHSAQKFLQLIFLDFSNTQRYELRANAFFIGVRGNFTTLNVACFSTAACTITFLHVSRLSQTAAENLLRIFMVLQPRNCLSIIEVNAAFRLRAMF